MAKKKKSQKTNEESLEETWTTITDGDSDGDGEPSDDPPIAKEMATKGTGTRDARGRKKKRSDK